MIFLKRQKKYFPVCVNENRFVCLSFYPNFIYLHFTCSIINYFVPFFTKTNMVILPPVSHLPDNNSYFDGQIPYTEISIILYKSHSTDGSTNLYINSYIQKQVYTYGQSSSPFMVNYINYKQKNAIKKMPTETLINK